MCKGQYSINPIHPEYGGTFYPLRDQCWLDFSHLPFMEGDNGRSM